MIPDRKDKRHHIRIKEFIIVKKKKKKKKNSNHLYSIC